MKIYLFEIYAYGFDTELRYQEVIAPTKKQAKTLLLTIYPEAYIINTFVEA